MVPFPFPTSTGGAFPQKDGFFVKCPTHLKAILRRPHEKFLQTLPLEERLTIDPAGFSAMPFNWQDKWLVICGLRIDGHYDRKKTKAVIGTDFNPVIPLNSFSELLANYRAIREGQIPGSQSEEYMEARRFISFTMHEIRRINVELKAKAEEALYEIRGPANRYALEDKTETIFAMSTLISTRLDAYDFHVNPDVFTAEAEKPIGVFKKFEKASHCLKALARKSDVSVRLTGQSFATLMGYDVFEIMPFVLLENAIKYSPNQGEVTVTFSRPAHEEVAIQSIGPMLLQGEAGRVFEERFRGELAKKVKPGTGIGLHFAKLVCDLHDVVITIESEPKEVCRINDIPYSRFRVLLRYALGTRIEHG